MFIGSTAVLFINSSLKRPVSQLWHGKTFPIVIPRKALERAKEVQHLEVRNLRYSVQMSKGKVQILIQVHILRRIFSMISIPYTSLRYTKISMQFLQSNQLVRQFPSESDWISHCLLLCSWDPPVLQASTGHCAVYAEESVYRQIDTLLAQEKKGPRVQLHEYVCRMCV